MNRVAILVITWNNWQDSIECIESLLAQTDKQCAIISLNNKSTDDSGDRLQQYIQRKSSPRIHYIESTVNGGTAGGFNHGIRWAIDHDYQYVGTLNADAIADSDWVSSLTNELDSHPEIGVATGSLLRRDGKTIDTTGDFYTTWGLPSPRFRDQPSDRVPGAPGEVFGSSGGGFIARTAMFKEIGLFDERFFMYYEDVDMSFRAQLHGYKVRFTPDAIAYHKLGASSKTVPGLAVYNTFKNLPILMWKNVPRSLLPVILPRFSLTYVLILASAVIKGKGLPAIKGVFRSITLLPHALRQRKIIQRSATVSASYIDSIILHDIPAEQTGMRAFRKIFTGRS